MLELPDPIRSAFLATVPSDFLAALVRALFQAYGAALSMCEGHMGAPETIDVLSVNRRALLETNLRTATRAFKHVENLSVSVEVNPRKTSRFTKIQIGELALTAARSKSMTSMPRSALYRENLFKSAQLTLYANRDESYDDKTLYAILLHGAPVKKKHSEDETNLAFPSFARVVFPDRDGRILTGIDLFTEVAECRDVVHEFIPPTEKVAVLPNLPMRSRRKKAVE